MKKTSVSGKPKLLNTFDTGVYFLLLIIKSWTKQGGACEATREGKKTLYRTKAARFLFVTVAKGTQKSFMDLNESSRMWNRIVSITFSDQWLVYFRMEHRALLFFRCISSSSLLLKKVAETAF